MVHGAHLTEERDEQGEARARGGEGGERFVAAQPQNAHMMGSGRSDARGRGARSARWTVMMYQIGSDH